MTAYEEAYAELDQLQGIDHNGEPVMKLRIQLADDPPKTEAGTFGVVLGFLMIGATLLTLAGMKVWDIAWRVMR